MAYAVAARGRIAATLQITSDEDASMIARCILELYLELDPPRGTRARRLTGMMRTVNSEDSTCREGAVCGAGGRPPVRYFAPGVPE
jgi:hypothetical protein